MVRIRFRNVLMKTEVFVFKDERTKTLYEGCDSNKIFGTHDH